MTLYQELLVELIPLVAKKLEAARAETDGIDWRTDYTLHRERTDAANECLKEFFSERYDARFTYRPPHDHAVKMAGIRSTSTGGIRGALQNWKRAAEHKLAAGACVVHRDGFNPHGAGRVDRAGGLGR